MKNKTSVKWVGADSNSSVNHVRFSDLTHKSCFREVGSFDDGIYMKVLVAGSGDHYVQSLGSTNLVVYRSPTDDTKVELVDVRITLQEVL